MLTGREAGGLAPGENPLGRLSRFDGTTFHPVAEGSVSAKFVHVFIHGWQPGYRIQERLHAVTDVVQSLPTWDPRLVDPTGRTLISDYLPLMEALVGLGEDHCVLWYSWLDEAATDAGLLLAFRSRQATQINGRRLAQALQQSFGRLDTRLHLIGHSHGSAVATHAAVSLGRAPEHLTILDAPESSISRLGGAANLIKVVLPRMRLGRGQGRTFVDSYSTVFGRPYHRKPGLSSVVDVVLTPRRQLSRDPIRTINSAHLYAIEWYALSVREAERGVGYGWSPLRDGDPTVLRSSYHSHRPQRPLDLHPRRLDLPLMGSAKRIASRPIRRTPVTGPGLHLNAQIPVAALILHSVPGDCLVEFDIDVLGGDGGEQIQIDVDEVPAFTAQSRFPVPASGRYVMLADGRPGDHLLTARLTTTRRPAGGRAGDGVPEIDAQPRVSIRNIQIVSPPGAVTGFSYERAAATMFLSGAAAGSIATLLTALTTGWTTRKLLALATRHRGRS